MKKILIFTGGVCLGALMGYIVVLLFKRGIGNNSGSEFFGDVYAEHLSSNHGGIGNNSNSKFYSDLYIKEQLLKDSQASPADTDDRI